MVDSVGVTVLPFRVVTWKTIDSSYSTWLGSPCEQWLRVDPPAFVQIAARGIRCLQKLTGSWTIHPEGVRHVPDTWLLMDAYLDDILAERFLHRELQIEAAHWRRDDGIRPWGTAPDEVTECWLNTTDDIGQSIIIRYGVSDGLIREWQRQTIEKQTLQRVKVQRSFDYRYDPEVPEGIFDEPTADPRRPMMIQTVAGMWQKRERAIAAHRARSPWAWEAEVPDPSPV